jgi:HprK-related kinase A
LCTAFILKKVSRSLSQIFSPRVDALRTPGLVVDVGPFRYALTVDAPGVSADWLKLYQGYSFTPHDSLADFKIDLKPPSFLRRYFRRNVIAHTDVSAPFVPMRADHSIVALEMAMNWQTALGSLQYLTLHAGVIAKNNQAIILPGASGSGKSTLSAAMGWRDWRFLSDEFALIKPDTVEVHPYPRPVSLKNNSIAVMQEIAPRENFSAIFPETIKGSISYLRPSVESLSEMHNLSTPQLLVFPQYTKGAAVSVESMEAPEALVRLIAGSANYDRMGEHSYYAVTQLVEKCPAFTLVYSNFDDADRVLTELLAKRVQA